MIVYALGFFPFLTTLPKRSKVSAEDISRFNTLRLMVAAFGSKFCGDSYPQPSILSKEEVGNDLLLIRKVGANKPLFSLLSNVLINSIRICCNFQFPKTINRKSEK